MNKFQAQFQTAYKNGEIPDFIHFYQMIDVLIIDDIQELTGKTGTQNAFFNIFNHLVANASFLERKITVSLAKEVLKAYVQLYRKEISIERIIETVCDHLNIDFARLSSPERTREVAQARQIAMYGAPFVQGRDEPDGDRQELPAPGRGDRETHPGLRRPDSTITKPRPCEARFFR